MADYQTEVCIIGAGVVGCAIARALAGAGRSVLVLEQNVKPGMGVTSRNSEIIHAGFYYPIGSLKARFCVRGRELLYNFAAEAKVDHQKTGKLVVATNQTQVPELEKLYQQGVHNGVSGLRLIDEKEVHALEPHVTAVAALLSEETGIISAHELCDALYLKAKDFGAEFAFKTPVLEIERKVGEWEVLTGDKENPFSVSAKLVINCAGLFADTIAELAGIDLDEDGYRQYWVKGEYFALNPRIGKKFSRPIYPVPEKNLRGLGVHLTVDLGGQAKLGPNVVEMPRAENYFVDEAHQKDFFEAAKLYLPELRLEDLSPFMAGIRPKLSRPGEPARDFLIQEESERGLPGLINLLGIESPGLTSALAIAEYIKEIAENS